MTQKLIPHEKLNKTDKKKRNAIDRRTWNGLCPVTRIVPNKKHRSRSQSKADFRKDGWER